MFSKIQRPNRQKQQQQQKQQRSFGMSSSPSSSPPMIAFNANFFRVRTARIERLRESNTLDIRHAQQRRLDDNENVTMMRFSSGNPDGDGKSHNAAMNRFESGGSDDNDIVTLRSYLNLVKTKETIDAAAATTSSSPPPPSMTSVAARKKRRTDDTYKQQQQQPSSKTMNYAATMELDVEKEEKDDDEKQQGRRHSNVYPRNFVNELRNCSSRLGYSATRSHDAFGVCVNESEFSLNCEFVVPARLSNGFLPAPNECDNVYHRVRSNYVDRATLYHTEDRVSCDYFNDDDDDDNAKENDETPAATVSANESAIVQFPFIVRIDRRIGGSSDDGSGCIDAIHDRYQASVKLRVTRQRIYDAGVKITGTAAIEYDVTRDFDVSSLCRVLETCAPTKSAITTYWYLDLRYRSRSYVFGVAWRRYVVRNGPIVGGGDDDDNNGGDNNDEKYQRYECNIECEDPNIDAETFRLLACTLYRYYAFQFHTYHGRVRPLVAPVSSVTVASTYRTHVSLLDIKLHDTTTSLYGRVNGVDNVHLLMNTITTDGERLDRICRVDDSVENVVAAIEAVFDMRLIDHAEYHARASCHWSAVSHNHEIVRAKMCELLRFVAMRCLFRWPRATDNAAVVDKEKKIDDESSDDIDINNSSGSNSSGINIADDNKEDDDNDGGMDLRDVSSYTEDDDDNDDDDDEDDGDSLEMLARPFDLFRLDVDTVLPSK